MSYARRLACALRRRGLTEDRISEVLADVRELTTATGTSAEDEFGSVEEYAQTFPQGRRRPVTPSRLGSWAVLLLAFGLHVLSVELRRRGAGPPLPWQATLLVWLAAFPAAAAVSALIDHRLPRRRRPPSADVPGRTPARPTAPSRGQR